MATHQLVKIVNLEGGPCTISALRDLEDLHDLPVHGNIAFNNLVGSGKPDIMMSGVPVYFCKSDTTMQFKETGLNKAPPLLVQNAVTLSKFKGTEAKPVNNNFLFATGAPDADTGEPPITYTQPDSDGTRHLLVSGRLFAMDEPNRLNCHDNITLQVMADSKPSGYLANMADNWLYSGTGMLTLVNVTVTEETVIVGADSGICQTQVAPTAFIQVPNFVYMTYAGARKNFSGHLTGLWMPTHAPFSLSRDNEHITVHGNVYTPDGVPTEANVHKANVLRNMQPCLAARMAYINSKTSLNEDLIGDLLDYRQGVIGVFRITDGRITGVAIHGHTAQPEADVQRALPGEEQSADEGADVNEDHDQGEGDGEDDDADGEDGQGDDDEDDGQWGQSDDYDDEGEEGLGGSVDEGDEDENAFYDEGEDEDEADEDDDSDGGDD